MVNNKRERIPFSNDLVHNARAIFGTVLALFLFLLFFQPLDPAYIEFNPKLLIISTFAAITLVFMFVFRVFIPLLFKRLLHPQKWNITRVFILSFLFVSFNSVAYVFFARYVGKIEITFQMVIKIVLLSIAPVASVLISSHYKYLKNHIQNLIELRNNRSQTINHDNYINFESDNNSEFLKVDAKDIVALKSANNYIEISFISDKKLVRKLIRSTLKRSEEKLAEFGTIIRCHRMHIINTKHVEELIKASDGYKLRMTLMQETVPVSRQHIIKVKELLKL